MSIVEKAAEALHADWLQNFEGFDKVETPFKYLDDQTRRYGYNQVIAVLKSIRDSGSPELFLAMQMAAPKWPSIQCDNQKELAMSFNQPKWEAAINHIIETAPK